MKKALSFVLSFALCISMSFVTLAAPIANINALENTTSVAPRSILHLVATGTNQKGTIKVAVAYSLNDSTNEIVGIQSAYISEYSPALYQKVWVHSYRLRTDIGRKVEVTVWYTDINGNDDSNYVNIIYVDI